MNVRYTSANIGEMRQIEFGNDVRSGLAAAIQEAYPYARIENRDPAMKFRVTDSSFNGLKVDIHGVHEGADFFHFGISRRGVPYLDGNNLVDTITEYLSTRGLELVKR
jgi:hypothetical protein